MSLAMSRESQATSLRAISDVAGDVLVSLHLADVAKSDVASDAPAHGRTGAREHGRTGVILAAGGKLSTW